MVDPLTIDVDRKNAVTITRDGGHVSRFPLEVLRANCLCAQCRARRDQGQPAWAPTDGGGTLQVESASQVGNWGLNLHWNDGHTAGIFTWEVLRAEAELSARAADVRRVITSAGDEEVHATDPCGNAIRIHRRRP